MSSLSLLLLTVVLSSPAAEPTAFERALRAVNAREPPLDRAARLTLLDGRVIDVVAITRGDRGWIVAQAGAVMTVADGTYRGIEIDLTSTKFTERLEALRARIAVLESR